MRTKYAIGLLILGLCIAGSAFALKAQFNVTPENIAESGFAIIAKAGDGGVVTVTVLRDPAQVRQHGPDSDIKTDQSATLRVFSEVEFVVECVMTPTPTKHDGEDRLMYWFKIDREHLKHSSLTVAEVDDYSDWEGREQLIGGGTFFEFRLGDYAVE